VAAAIASVAQRIGIPIGATLSPSDTEAIANFYASRKLVEDIVLEVTSPTAPVQTSSNQQAGNDEKFTLAA
jgi:hypothetical protein